MTLPQRVMCYVPSFIMLHLTVACEDLLKILHHDLKKILCSRSTLWGILARKSYQHFYWCNPTEELLTDLYFLLSVWGADVAAVTGQLFVPRGKVVEHTGHVTIAEAVRALFVSHTVPIQFKQGLKVSALKGLRLVRLPWRVPEYTLLRHYPPCVVNIMNIEHFRQAECGI